MSYENGLASEGKVIQPQQLAGLVEREDFWADTCREFPQMRHASQATMEMYRKFGCRFCVPGRQQIEYVLSALDAAVPGWEKEHPELFFQTLELNYPELVRHS